MPKAAALRKPKKKVNPLDKEGITYIDYKDTALLRKFISDRGTRRGEAQFGVVGQVADDRDGGLSCHRLLLVSIHASPDSHIRMTDRVGAPFVSGRPAGSPWYAVPTR